MNADVEYIGVTEGIGHAHVYARRDGTSRQVEHHERHSHGFEWGYAGSGPADLARCLLADFVGVGPVTRGFDKGRIPEIDHLYQKFKFEKISFLPKGKGWTMSGAEIADWLAKNPIRKTCPEHREVIEGDQECLGCKACPACDGDGQIDGETTCTACDGDGTMQRN